MLKVRSVFLLPREGTGNAGGTASTLSDRGGGGCVDCPLTQCRSPGNLRRSGLWPVLPGGSPADLPGGPPEPLSRTLADQPETSPVI